MSTATGLIDEVGHLDPKAAAERLIRAQGEEIGWLDAFTEHLDRRRNADSLKRILSTWDLNQSDAARVFGVSRQAISKWFDQGVPPERAAAVADLAAADAEHGEVVGEKIIAGEVVEGGNQQAFGQIAGRAEDDHDARFAERIRGGHRVLKRRTQRRVGLVGVGSGVASPEEGTARSCEKSTCRAICEGGWQIGESWLQEKVRLGGRQGARGIVSGGGGKPPV